MTQPKQLRGFAVMKPEDVRRISSLGGKACHEQKTGHEWDSAEAQAAGKKGGATRAAQLRKT